MRPPRYLLAFVISSCIASAGIIFPHVWFFSLLGLALFFLTLRATEITTTRSLVYGLIFGALTGGAGTVWFWETLPLDFLGILNPTVQRIAVGMTWAYVSLSLAVAIALASPVIKHCPRLCGGSLITALVWCLAERGRMWGFALATWAPESLLGPHFSIASVGYPLTESSILRPLAQPLGIDGLNFCAAFVASVCCELLVLRTPRPTIKRLVTEVSVVVIVFATPHVLRRSDAADRQWAELRFAVLANNFMDVRDLSSHSFLQEQIAEVARAEPPIDVMILPEEFSFTSIFWSHEEAEKFIRMHFGERDVLILHTRNDAYPADETNASPEAKKLVYEGTRSGELARYIKRNLMPLGEYAPAFTRTFFSLLDDRELKLYLDTVHEFAVEQGSETVTAVTWKGATLGGLLCSDLLSPSLYRSLVAGEGAQVLVNLANQFWFHGSRALYWKTLQIARVHAVQNQTPFVVANNVAPSFILDRRGYLVAESQWGDSHPLYGVVRVPKL